MKELNPTSETETRKSSILLTEEEEKQYEQQSEEKALARKQQYKKWLVFTLMGLVFLGCMYLLFGNNTEENTQKDVNELVPQAEENLLPNDKEIAYEQEMLNQKQAEKEAALGVLSDYWKENEVVETSQDKKQESYSNPIAQSTHSYQDIHRTLGDFYQDNSALEEKQRLQEEIKMLKTQLTEKEYKDPLDTQMALMEKSYQMASKYLPKNQKDNSIATKSDEYEKRITEELDKTDKDILPVYNLKNQTVSRLPRQHIDSNFYFDELVEEKRGFLDTNVLQKEIAIPKNSIRACIHTKQFIGENSRVQLRLLEPVRVSGIILPKGELLTATAKMNGDRLQLHIKSIEYKGKLMDVSIMAYDLDGQQGLYIPYTPDANAFREIAASMGGNSGTNFTFNSSAKDQVISDIAKGVVQGGSKYLSQKIANPSIEVKAGYQLLLMSKK